MLTRNDLTSERLKAIFLEAEAKGLYRLLSDEERQETRRLALAQLAPGEDLWVFGYGSLMWNPALEFEEQRLARLYGYHRRFCLQIQLGRGSPERPGLMLALDRGGSCQGIAFRIAARNIEAETRLLWNREMLSGAYRPTWVRLRAAGEIFRAVTFVANRRLDRYCGGLEEAETVERLATGCGELGSCRDYLAKTVRHLEEVGVHDPHLHRLLRQVESRD
ncbi:gamma-glutamylcyclotransferase [Oceanibacterium hippocampi]|uniref:glutathione-specific gamma-glutamylcyclotransferase n=1 Tax=Oceanibacterium hippocampi TaxID=745714 RepID=A0A1Y5S839_9PROT|nr:gamma-glutamylcyclotransferase [Oceanibacterium hippocampi]SLN34562.1 ChaC-like protein [Oceanibacterium hippocampi]